MVASAGFMKRTLRFRRGIRVPVVGLIALGLLLVARPNGEAARALAFQNVPEPPPLVATFLESDLTGPEIFAPDTCLTGGGGGENVGEGLKLYVRGRCTQGANVAAVAVRAKNIGVGDGEVAIDFKAVTGADRAGLNLYARIRGATFINAYLNLAAGQAELHKRTETGFSLLATSFDIGEIDRTNWNRLALRFVGDEAWVLVNDKPVMYGSGIPSEYGNIGLQVLRDGNPDDGDEVAVVFSGLTISGFQEPSEPESKPEDPTPAPNPVLRP
jgi:hypothetical protein